MEDGAFVGSAGTKVTRMSGTGSNQFGSIHRLSIYNLPEWSASSASHGVRQDEKPEGK